MVNRLTHQLNTVAVVTAVTVTVATITIAFAVIIIIIVVRCSFIPLPTLLHRPGCFCSQSQVEGIKAVCVCADVWMWAAAAIVLCHLVGGFIFGLFVCRWADGGSWHDSVAAGLLLPMVVFIVEVVVVVVVAALMVIATLFCGGLVSFRS